VLRNKAKVSGNPAEYQVKEIVRQVYVNQAK
jgi:hypothetical protein